MNNEKIIWPLKFAPSYCPVFVHNEIHINTSPEKIWYWLINAPTWHEWYPNASKIQLPNQHNNYLLAGTKFEWKTFGVSLESEVLEFVPYQRLAWSAKGKGISAWHAWLIIPTKTGCKVI